jgi:pimeloyl-ACP methyl ester carboxylesterase
MRAADQITPVMSAIVSYQYEDSIDGSLSSGGILSPVASYQYFDWPGDDILQLTSSSSVSYFYNIGLQYLDVALHGQVVDPAGLPLQNVLLTVGVLDKVITTTASGTDGTYQLPFLPAGIYSLTAQSPEFVSDKRVLSLTLDSAQQNFQLGIIPGLPDLRTANSTPPFRQLADPLEGAKLMVFDGNDFLPNPGPLDKTKMTIVLTHGFEDASRNWPLEMAKILNANKAMSVANIVVWDWEKAANHSLGTSHGNTLAQGMALAKALLSETALGANYSKEIHFLGHSFGTLVNARAANYLHGDKVDSIAPPSPTAPAWQPSNTHLTLFDEAELGALTEKGVLISAGLTLIAPSVLKPVAAAITAVAIDAAYITPVPKRFAWIDNYVSAYGVYRPEAVNVLLQKAESVFDPTPSWFGLPSVKQYAMHAYGYQLYKASVHLPSDSDLFFRRSFEAAKLLPEVSDAFPPSVSDLNPPTAYRQSPNASNDLVLDKMQGGLAAYQLRFIQAGADSVVDSVEQGVTGTFTKIADASISVVERVAVTIEDATQWLVDRASTSASAVVDLINKADFRLTLTTGLPPLRPHAVQASTQAAPSNTPAYVSLPIVISPDALAMLFDFTVSGEPKEDSLVCGIDDAESGGITTNLFAIQAKFIPRNQTSSSSLIDVSTYAGTTNNLFFGILGGTSTNCSVQIDSIRFFSFSSPALEASRTNDLLQLSWPSSAFGYVLESAATLEPPAWSPVTNAPAIFAGRISIKSPMSDQTHFFRLHQR